MASPGIERTALARLVDAPAFGATVLVVILANAVVLGLQTYDRIESEYGWLLDVLNAVFLAVRRRAGDPVRVLPAAVAVLRRLLERLRLRRHRRRLRPRAPREHDGLRLARLARVVRIFRVLPELRILLTAIGRSLPPLGSMAILTTVILFVYGMIGWSLFAEEDPDHWGDIGEAMLTLFVMLTLEDFPVYLERGREIEPWSVVYFVSFILIAAFVVLNVLIRVVLNSMEEARAIHTREELRSRGVEATDEEAAIASRIATLRNELDELEAMLERAARGAGRSAAPP
jgi:voltage-gated sodium channel